MSFKQTHYQNHLKALTNIEIGQEEERLKGIRKEIVKQLEELQDKEIAIHLEKADRGWYTEANRKWLDKYEDGMDGY